MVPDLVRIGDMLACVENVVDRLLQYVEDVMVSVGEEREKKKEGVLVRKEVKPTQYMYHSQNGKIPPNSAVGRLLMETVSIVPQIDSSQFEQMMNSAMQVYTSLIAVVITTHSLYLLHSILQDLLMVMYLAKIQTVIVGLGEQLGHI